MGRWVNASWVWDLRWRRELRDRESEAVSELLECAAATKLTADRHEEWCWGDGGSGAYSVRKGYELLEASHSDGAATSSNVKAAAAAWKSPAPFKYQTMAWRAVCNKLPTRDNLSKRIALSPERQLCPCCGQVNESAVHLFLRCKEVEPLWAEILRWVGVSWAAPDNIPNYFLSFSSLLRRKNGKRVLGGVWTCVLWAIWKWRNKLIF
ncbi:hypothetical protein OROHE_021969 [Orobanche hederae]